MVQTDSPGYYISKGSSFWVIETVGKQQKKSRARRVKNTPIEKKHQKNEKYW
jgi:hypothetical protein